MALSDWLAAIGGGAAAVDQAHTDDEKRQLEEKRIAATENAATIRADVQRMLGELNAGSRERIAGQNNDTKRDIAGETNRTRQTIADLNDVGRTTRATDAEKGRNRRFDQGDETTRRGQNLNDTHFWENSSRLYDQMFTTDATRRRGQDITQSTAERGQDMGSETASVSRRSRTALGILGLKARSKPSVFSPADATNWAEEYDKLVNNPDEAAAAALSTTDDAGAAAAPSPAQTPPAAATVSTRPRVPIPPRTAPTVPAGAAAAPAPPVAAPAMPKGLTPGASVTLKSGKRVTVTKVNPDGTFEYQ